MKRLASVLVLLVLSAGCSLSGLAFRQDDRVDILHPLDRATVGLPIELRWHSEVEPRSSGGPYFAVFVDREPIAPGDHLRELADEVCERTPGCPDRAYLADRFVFVTEKTRLRIDAVPASSVTKAGRDKRHQATIVLVDADGRRMGEAAYTVEFTVEDG